MLSWAVCSENGLAAESERAAVWEINPGSGEHRIYASGLRNPVGLAWEPHTGVLWVAVNERDEMGAVADYKQCPATHFHDNRNDPC